MSSKRFKELKNMTADEIKTKIRETEAQLFQDRMKQVTGQLANPAALWKMRKDIARMKTIQTAQANTHANTKGTK